MFIFLFSVSTMGVLIGYRTKFDNIFFAKVASLGRNEKKKLCDFCSKAIIFKIGSVNFPLLSSKIASILWYLHNKDSLPKHIPEILMSYVSRE